MKKVKLPDDLGNFSCNGCGACCRKFVLPLSPSELYDALRNSRTRNQLRLKMSDHNDMDRYRNEALYEDIEIVATMVRYLGEYKQPKDGRRAVGLMKADHQTLYWYTCIHYDKKTKKCGIQSVKPRMCYAFPFYGRQIPVFSPELYPTCQYTPLVIEARERAKEAEELRKKQEMEYRDRDMPKALKAKKGKMFKKHEALGAPSCRADEYGKGR